MSVQPSDYEPDSYYLVSEFLLVAFGSHFKPRAPMQLFLAFAHLQIFNFSTLTKIAAAREKIKLHPLKVLALNTL